MMPKGSINAWKCDTCGGLTVAIHADEGVTPMWLACRRTPGCPGNAVSAGYPPPPIPPHILDLLAWEWFRPTAQQVRRMKRTNPEMAAHIERGGLDLRLLAESEDR